MDELNEIFNDWDEEEFEETDSSKYILEGNFTNFSTTNTGYYNANTGYYNAYTGYYNANTGYYNANKKNNHRME